MNMSWPHLRGIITILIVSLLSFQTDTFPGIPVPGVPIPIDPTQVGKVFVDVATNPAAVAASVVTGLATAKTFFDGVQIPSAVVDPHKGSRSVDLPIEAPSSLQGETNPLARAATDTQAFVQEGIRESLGSGRPQAPKVILTTSLPFYDFAKGAKRKMASQGAGYFSAATTQNWDTYGRFQYPSFAAFVFNQFNLYQFTGFKDFLQDAQFRDEFSVFIPRIDAELQTNGGFSKQLKKVGFPRDFVSNETTKIKTAAEQASAQAALQTPQILPQYDKYYASFTAANWTTKFAQWGGSAKGAMNHPSLWMLENFRLALRSLPDYDGELCNFSATIQDNPWLSGEVDKEMRRVAHEINASLEAAQRRAKAAAEKVKSQTTTTAAPVPPTPPDEPKKKQDEPKKKPTDQPGTQPNAAKQGELVDASFSQRTCGKEFSIEGKKLYLEQLGRSINTTEDLANALKSGEVKASQVPIDCVTRDGTKYMLNTRTSKALEQAGIPRDQWFGVDRTGQAEFEARLTNQLTTNRTPSGGFSEVRQSSGIPRETLAKLLGVSVEEADRLVRANDENDDVQSMHTGGGNDFFLGEAACGFSSLDGEKLISTLGELIDWVEDHLPKKEATPTASAETEPPSMSFKETIQAFRETTQHENTLRILAQLNNPAITAALQKAEREGTLGEMLQDPHIREQLRLAQLALQAKQRAGLALAAIPQPPSIPVNPVATTPPIIQAETEPPSMSFSATFEHQGMLSTLAQLKDPTINSVLQTANREGHLDELLQNSQIKDVVQQIQRAQPARPTSGPGVASAPATPEAMKAQEEAMRAQEKAQEDLDKLVQVAAGTIKFLWAVGVKTPYKFIRDLGQAYAYLSNPLPISPILPIDLFYNADYIHGAILAIDSYREVASYAPLQYIGVTLLGPISEMTNGTQPIPDVRALNAQKQEAVHHLNNVFALLQIPPQRYEEIQKIAADTTTQINPTGTETQETQLARTTKTLAIEICRLSNERIQFAQTAKRELDQKKFAEAKTALQQAIDVYDQEIICWQQWLINRNALASLQQPRLTEDYWEHERMQLASAPNPLLSPDLITQLIDAGKAIEQAYATVHYTSPRSRTEKRQFDAISANLQDQLNAIKITLQHPAVITLPHTLSEFVPLICSQATMNLFGQCTGNPVQHNIHTKLVRCVNQTASFYKDWVFSCTDFTKSFHIENMTHIVTHFADLARVYSGQNKIMSAYNLSDFCSELVFFEQLLIGYVHDKENKTANFWTFLWGKSAENYFNERMIDGIKKITDDEKLWLQTSLGNASSILCRALEHAYADRAAFERKITQEAPGYIRAVETGQEHAAELLVAYVMETLYQGDVCRMLISDITKEALKNIVRIENATNSLPVVLPSEYARLLAPTKSIFTEALQLTLLNARQHQAATPAPSQPLATTTPPATVPKESTAQPMRNFVMACDEAYKTSVPLPPIARPGSHVVQLRCLYQFYQQLETLAPYGSEYGLLCGYYALHNAKVFATNPGATHEQLLPLLNSRGQFETETLTPGKALIRTMRPVGDVNGTAHLLGQEIRTLIPIHLRNQIIVIGAATLTPEENEASVADAEVEVQAFHTGQLNQLIWILPANSDTHWIVARTQHDTQGLLEITLADSAGFDQRQNTAVLEVLEHLSRQPAPPQGTPPAPTSDTTNTTPAQAEEPILAKPPKKRVRRELAFLLAEQQKARRQELMSSIRARQKAMLKKAEQKQEARKVFARQEVLKQRARRRAQKPLSLRRTVTSSAQPDLTLPLKRQLDDTSLPQDAPFIQLSYYESETEAPRRTRARTKKQADVTSPSRTWEQRQAIADLEELGKIIQGQRLITPGQENDLVARIRQRLEDLEHAPDYRDLPS